MERGAALRRAGLVVLGANVALAAAKGLVWLETGSLAVGSEAANSLVDTAYSAAVVAGLYLTTRSPDVDHPHGHERIEPFVSLVIAIGVLAVGAVLLWRSATAVLAGEVNVTQGPIALAVLGAGAGAKYLLYRYCLRAGEVHDSPALVATALDSRIDVLTAGAALIGVAGAQVGFPLLDPLAAGVVSLAILHTGVGIARDNVNYLIGRAPPAELQAAIIERALAHPDVEGVHEVVAHYVGPEVDVSLHVEVEGDRTIEEAHGIETDVIGSVQDVSAVDDAFVHIDPKGLGEWKADPGSDAENAAGTAPSTRSAKSSRPSTSDSDGDSSSG
jgi:cation diffusion facilitator family transporter